MRIPSCNYLINIVSSLPCARLWPEPPRRFQDAFRVPGALPQRGGRLSVIVVIVLGGGRGVSHGPRASIVGDLPPTVEKFKMLIHPPSEVAIDGATMPV